MVLSTVAALGERPGLGVLVEEAPTTLVSDTGGAVDEVDAAPVVGVTVVGVVVPAVALFEEAPHPAKAPMRQTADNPVAASARVNPVGLILPFSLVIVITLHAARRFQESRKPRAFGSMRKLRLGPSRFCQGEMVTPARQNVRSALPPT
jgi:hypothetical protein